MEGSVKAERKRIFTSQTMTDSMDDKPQYLVFKKSLVLNIK